MTTARQITSSEPDDSEYVAGTLTTPIATPVLLLRNDEECIETCCPTCAFGHVHPRVYNDEANFLLWAMNDTAEELAWTTCPDHERQIADMERDISN